MAQKIASSVFAGAPTDTLSVADVYLTPTVDLLTSLASTLSSVLDSVFNSIRTAGLDLSELAELLKSLIPTSSKSSGSSYSSTLASSTTTTSEAVSRLSSALGINVSAISDLPEEVKNQAVANLISLSGINVSTLGTITGDRINVTPGTSAQNANGIINGINAVLGDTTTAVPTVVDGVALQAFLLSLYNYAVDYGLSDAAGTAASALNQSAVDTDTASDIVTAMVSKFPTAVGNSDLDTMQTILNNTTPGAVVAKYPSAVNDIISTYTLDPSISVSEYPSVLTKMTNVLGTINSTWSTDTRDGVTVNSLSPFDGLSDGAAALFATSEEHQATALLAQTYSSANTVELLRQFYPNIALRSSTVRA